jgi:hypothetical protein
VIVVYCLRQIKERIGGYLIVTPSLIDKAENEGYPSEIGRLGVTTRRFEILLADGLARQPTTAVIRLLSSA